MKQYTHLSNCHSVIFSASDRPEHINNECHKSTSDIPQRSNVEGIKIN